jgi:hypothetical protein
LRLRLLHWSFRVGSGTHIYYRHACRLSRDQRFVCVTRERAVHLEVASAFLEGRVRFQQDDVVIPSSEIAVADLVTLTRPDFFFTRSPVAYAQIVRQTAVPPPHCLTSGAIR